MAIFGLGLLELGSVLGFMAGYFFGIPALALACGLLVVLDDIREIGTGVLRPLEPVLLAAGLACLLAPWYMGVFWASAVFKLLNIRAYRRNFLPRPRGLAI